MPRITAKPHYVNSPQRLRPSAFTEARPDYFQERRARRLNYVHAYGRRFRRPPCGRCGQPVFFFGEAVRVDNDEAAFVVVHSCLNCVRRSRLSAVRAGGREAIAA